MKYDLLIKNGTVYDGLGNAPRTIDIGIVGGEIKELGELKSDSAITVIDATGKYVAPGFIDITNHSDTHWTLFSSPAQQSLLRQGITTIVGGNCGSSLAPFVGEATEEEIGRWTDVAKININWSTMSEFLNELGRRALGVNFCTMVGLNTLAKAVLGKDTRMPNDQELNQMKLLFKNALDEGAVGISANLGLIHLKSRDDSELIGIFQVARKYNAMVNHHLEDEGDNLLPSLSRVINMASKSGSRLHLTHFKALGKKSWGNFAQAIQMIENARSEGVEITCDFFPYTKTGSSLVMILPQWFRNLPLDEKHKILADKENMLRKSLSEFLQKMTLHYDRMIIASAGDLGHVGKTIGQIAAETELSGEEFTLNLLAANNFRVSIFNEVIQEENIEQIATRSFSVVSSDGAGYDLPYAGHSDIPHPRSFGAFPRVFKNYVAGKGILTWEQAVYKMTGLPAKIVGLADRGILAEGKKADIVILNPSDISDFSTYEDPFHYAQGISHVLVNGVMTVENGEFTEKMGGRILKRK